MTDEAKALVERLREGSVIRDDGRGTTITRTTEAERAAADLIETQAREIERLRKALPVDIDLTVAALEAWGPQIASGYTCPAAAQTMFVAAQQLKTARAALGESHD